MIQKTIKTINKYNMLDPKDHIIVGLSGGADSVCLLHLLIFLKYKITAVHINHGIRPKEATEDERFVVNLCNILDIPLIIKKYLVLNIAKEEKKTVEEAARDVRYEAFEEAMKEANATKIATAHTKTDNTETILFNFLRGSTLKGLRGIPPVRDYIIRPIIDSTREEIEDYCRKNNLNYVIDSTNLKIEYTRNKIRIKLIPYLKKEYNPNIIETLTQNAIFFEEDSLLLDDFAKKSYITCLEKESITKIELNRDCFLKEPKAIQFRILQKSLYKISSTHKNINSKHISAARDLIEDGKNGNSVDLANNITVINAYKNIIITTKTIKNDYIYPLQLDDFFYVQEGDFYISATLNQKIFKKEFHNLCTKIFNYDKIHSMCVRNRKNGDKVGTKKLKKLLIDKKIPKHLRDDIPLIAIGSNVIWAIDVFSAEALQDTKDKVYIQLWEKI